MTTAELRAKKMDVKHAMLAEAATQAKDRCEELCREYVPWPSVTVSSWLDLEKLHLESHKTLEPEGF